MFPQDYLARLELSSRGEREGVYCKAEGSDGPLFMAFVWNDRNQRYFISTTSSLTDGEAYSRVRWRQVNTKDPNVFPERMELKVPQPKAAGIYYSCCAMIDCRHNRCRQAG
jgi:hypothetical protein